MSNGAQALIRTLVDAGVDTCFTNPGTSEIHFVAALDSVPEMRAVLTLFEGVATGAADGYARMADAPAATLLAPGTGARQRAGEPPQRAPRQGPGASTSWAITRRTTRSTTRRCSPTSRRSRATCRRGCGRRRSAEELARDAVEAIAAATGPPGQVATLIVPADVSWQEGAEPAAPLRAGGSTRGPGRA